MHNYYPIRFGFIVALLVFFGASAVETHAQGNVGLFQTYIILEVDTPGNVWAAGGANANQSLVLDSVPFNNSPTITIKGAEIQSWKTLGGDVTGAKLLYNVHLDNEAAGTFKEIDLPWAEDLMNPGDQKWQNLAIDSSITDGLADGNYVLEVYWKITTNQGNRFDNNNGQNFRATFTIGTPIGITENGQISQLELYPNPTNSGITINVNGPGQLEIADLSGRMVHRIPLQNQVTSSWIDLSDLQKGMYLIIFREEHGRISTQKVLVTD